jgi:hypothetical protein
MKSETGADVGNFVGTDESTEVLKLELCKEVL